LPGLPSTADWAWLPHAPLFDLSRARHEPERVVALLSAGIFAFGALPFFLFTPDAPRGRMPLLEAFGRGAGGLGSMVRTVRKHRDAGVSLLSRMFFVDGM